MAKKKEKREQICFPFSKVINLDNLNGENITQPLKVLKTDSSQTETGEIAESV